MTPSMASIPVFETFDWLKFAVDLYCAPGTTDGNMNEWDVSRITVFAYLFNDTNTCNANISAWDTSKATSFEVRHFAHPLERSNSDAFSRRAFPSWVLSTACEASPCPFPLARLPGQCSFCSVLNQALVSIRGPNMRSCGVCIASLSQAMFLQAAFNQSIGDWDTRQATTFGVRHFAHPLA